MGAEEAGAQLSLPLRGISLTWERRAWGGGPLRIKNMDSLCSQGNTAARTTILDVLEAGLDAADPYPNVMKLMRLEGDRLTFDGKQLNPTAATVVFDLSRYKHIYVIGGGKAAQRMAQAVEDVLGDRITEGHINAKKGEGKQLTRIEVTEAGHPMPDEDSVAGAKRIVEIARKAGKGDLVIRPGSGGATALTTYPPPGVPLEDLNATTRMLYFECGAPIWEVNDVRLVVSSITAGRLEAMMRDADVVNIATSENWPKGRMERHVAQLSYENAVQVLTGRKLWNRIPRSVRSFLAKADPALGPVPHHEVQAITRRWHSFSVMDGDYMLRGAKQRAEALGLHAAILTHRLCAEAREVSVVMASIASEMEDHRRPFKPPCVLLSGGELLVEVGTATGRGGRNQEFALAAAPHIQGSERIVVAAADSDGTDGPTDAAGGVVDGATMDRVKNLGLDVFEELRNHNSNHVLKTLGDAIITGVQGTNVQDLRIVFVSDRA